VARGALIPNHSAIFRELFRTDWECEFSPIAGHWHSLSQFSRVGDSVQVVTVIVKEKREARVEEYVLRTVLTKF
jgi:hypothetical protein